MCLQLEALKKNQFFGELFLDGNKSLFCIKLLHIMGKNLKFFPLKQL